MCREVWNFREEEEEEEEEEDRDDDDDYYDWERRREKEAKERQQRARNISTYFNVPLPILKQMIPFAGLPEQVRKRCFELSFRTGGEGMCCFERWGVFERLQQCGFDLVSSRFLGEGKGEGGGVWRGRGEAWRWVRDVGGVGKGVKFYLGEIGGKEGGRDMLPVWEGRFGGREEEVVRRAVEWEGKESAGDSRGWERRRRGRECVGREDEREREEAFGVIKERLKQKDWEKRWEGVKGLGYMIDRDREEKEDEGGCWKGEEGEGEKKERRREIDLGLKEKGYGVFLKEIDFLSLCLDPCEIVQRETLLFLAKYSLLFDFEAWAEVIVGTRIGGEGLQMLNRKGICFLEFFCIFILFSDLFPTELCSLFAKIIEKPSRPPLLGLSPSNFTPLLSCLSSLSPQSPFPQHETLTYIKKLLIFVENSSDREKREEVLLGLQHLCWCVGKHLGSYCYNELVQVLCGVLGGAGRWEVRESVGRILEALVCQERSESEFCGGSDGMMLASSSISLISETVLSALPIPPPASLPSLPTYLSLLHSVALHPSFSLSALSVSPFSSLFSFLSHLPSNIPPENWRWFFWVGRVVGSLLSSSSSFNPSLSSSLFGLFMGEGKKFSVFCGREYFLGLSLSLSPSLCEELEKFLSSFSSQRLSSHFHHLNFEKSN